MLELSRYGLSIWLDCPFEKVHERVKENDERPLARDAEAFRKLYDARQEQYAKADIHIVVKSDDPMVAVRYE